MRRAEAKRLDRAFGALAHPARRELLRLLKAGPAAVTELADRFPVSLPAVSKHLGVLERSGLVRIRPSAGDGRVRLCTLHADGLDAAEEWISRTRAGWERRLDAMERVLARSAPRTGP
jgi:DNA-binding transcriptional ArsR family regulator